MGTVRFILGRAGSGKTFACVQAIRQALLEDAVDGPALLFLVPEQSALQAERAILDPLEVPAAHRASVLSFRRLAFKVLETAGSGTWTVLSESARVMVLRHLANRHAGELRYFGRVRNTGGFVDRLAATIKELIEEAVEEGDLSPGGAGGVDADDPPSAWSAKRHDIQLLYSAYRQYLGANRLDPGQFLQAARDRLDACPWLNGARIWLDGFASLSGQELLTVGALARRALHVEVTLLLDPALVVSEIRHRLDGLLHAPTTLLFRKTLSGFHRWMEFFERSGIRVDPPLVLGDEPSPRFAANPTFSRLERTLFVDHAGIHASDGSGSIRTGAVSPVVELLELPTRRAEVDYAVARIKEWVREHPEWRYRDISIITRDLTPYHDLLSAALDAQGIPYFIDRRRPVVHHPLVELLRTIPMILGDDFSMESVRALLKSGLLPWKQIEMDELENFVIARGLQGLDAWQSDSWKVSEHFSSSPLASASSPGTPSSGTSSSSPGVPSPSPAATEARLNRYRRRMVDLLGPLLPWAGEKQSHSGADWATALRQWLDHAGAGETLRRWADVAEEWGDVERAAEHRQVWSDVSELLDDLGSAFADSRLTTRELAEVLDQGLSGLTVGLAPPMIDQLLVGTVERSRQPEILAAVILGFNTGMFPRTFTEDCILNDDDRRRLRKDSLPVGPPADERVLEDSLLTYVALTRARLAMVVTWSATDDQGRPLRPSPYLKNIQRACPGSTVRSPRNASCSAPWSVQSTPDVVARLVLEYGGNAPDDASVEPGVWNAVYEENRLAWRDDRVIRGILGSLRPPGPASLSPRTMGRMRGTPLQTSVSELETFAACPFKHFSQFGLRLREREEADLAPVDVGRIQHAVLDDWVRTLSSRGTSPARLSDEELTGTLTESCSRIGSRLRSGEFSRRAHESFQLRRTHAWLHRSLRFQRFLASRGRTRPAGSEISFGAGMGGLPPLELTTPGGRRVWLRGSIDRVDIAEHGSELVGVVIDYKRMRDKRLVFDEIHHGLSLQLLGYLIVLAQHGSTLTGRPIRPMAGLYHRLGPGYRRVEHGEIRTDRSGAEYRSYMPRGLIDASLFPVLEESSTPGWSSSYLVHVRKDGGVSDINRGDAVDPALFQLLLDRTRELLGRFCDSILDGEIEVSPYRLRGFSPCGWCPFGSVCRYDGMIDRTRFLPAMSRAEVLGRIQDE